MATGAVIPVEFLAAGAINGLGQCRYLAAPPRLCRVCVHRSVECHLQHLVVRAVTRLAGVGLAFGSGHFTGTAQRFQVREQIASLLAGPIGGAVEQRLVRRHHRAGDDRTWRKQVREVPVSRSRIGGARQVGPDAPRAPQVWIVEARLPRQRRRAKPRHVGVQVANLLRVAVRAPFAAVDGAAAPRAVAQSQWMRRRHRRCLRVDDPSRPYTEQPHRHGEEEHTGNAGDQIGLAYRAAGAHAAPPATGTSFGATCSTGAEPILSSTACQPPPRGPVVRPTSSETNPPATSHEAPCARITQ